MRSREFCKCRPIISARYSSVVEWNAEHNCGTRSTFIRRCDGGAVPYVGFREDRNEC
jgi:hypothetical protein